MEIIHHVVFAGTDQITDIIRSLGIKYEGNPPHNIGVFDIAESDPNWPAVSRLIAEKDLPAPCYTIFTTDEVLSAEWLRVNVVFEQSHAQPESTWEEATLDLERGCPKCRLGAVQKASFQIKKEPHLGKKDFMSLRSTAAVLASMRVFDGFETAGLRGYEKRPVLIRSTQEPAKNVAQICATLETEAGLLGVSELKTEVGRRCGHKKFNRVMRGPMQYRRDALPRELDFARSHEWFGSGGVAFQEMFVSNRVARIVIDRGWRGVLLDPLELH